MKNLILFLFLTLIISCEKNHHVIHVSATNIVTGEPYEGLKISVVATTPGVFESHYKNVYEGYLDTNGEATFDLKMKNNKSYNLGIELPENTCYFNDLYFNLKHDQETQNVEVEFAPCAYIKYTIENINCQGITDTMRFRRKTSLDNWDGWSNPLPGCYFLEQDYVDVPLGWRIYEWEVDRLGVVTSFTDSIYLDEGEYGTFVMEY